VNGIRSTCAASVSIIAALSALVALEPQSAGGLPRFDPAAHFTRDQQARLRTGAAVVSVPDSDAGELAMVGAVHTDAAADRLIEWARHSNLLYSKPAGPGGARLSKPPRIEDFSGVTLTAPELESLRKCKPGDCIVKLAAGEMSEIRRAIAAAGSNWKPAALDGFRRVLVSRAATFLSKGHAGAPTAHDHDKPVEPGAEFARIIQGPERNAVAPLGVDAYLRALPAQRADVESLLFWWKSTASGTRETIFITHVAIFNHTETQDVVIAESQVYASHYLEASVTYLLLTGDPPNRYFVYLRRAKVDALRGLFGGIVRAIAERRVRNDGPRLIIDLKKKIEAGPPPVTR
jgi:hypothetical protein